MAHMAKNRLALRVAGLHRGKDAQLDEANARQREAPLARRLRARRWYAPAMTLITLLGMIALIAAASAGARANAEVAAQQRLAQAARMGSALLTTNGATLSVDDNDQLVATSANSSIILAHDASLINHLSALTAATVAIYQAKGDRLVAVAASAGSSATRGTSLADPARSTLLRRQQFTGQAQLDGQAYEVSAVPLFDQANLFVGAVAVATPLAVVMRAPTQLTVMLSLVGLLLTLLTLALGLWFAGAFGGQALATLNVRLATLGVAAAQVEESIGAHAIRAQRQERIGRLLDEDAYQLATLASALGEHQRALQEAVNSVWASVSQPGGAPDTQKVLWLVRQTAVNAARLGASAEEAESLCQQMTPLLNRLIGEDRALSESAATTQRQANTLRQAVEQVEITVGANLTPRHNRGIVSLMERAHAVSQRLRQGTGALRAGRPGRQSGRLSAEHEHSRRLTPPIAEGKRPTPGFSGIDTAPLKRPFGAPSHQPPQPKMRRMPSPSRPSSSSPASPTPLSSWPPSPRPGIGSWSSPKDPKAPNPPDTPHTSSSGWRLRNQFDAADNTSSHEDESGDWLND